jgi:hypothetical protein
LRQEVRDADGDAAAARPQIGNEYSILVFETSHNMFDQQFSFRTWNQSAIVAHKSKAIKVALATNVSPTVRLCSRARWRQKNGSG